MIYVTFIIPLIITIVGYLMYKYPPKKPNWFIGYRTRKSMQDEKIWKTSNEKCGKLWIKMGAIMLIIAALLSIFIYFKILTFSEIFLAIIVFCEILPLLLSELIIENKRKTVILIILSIILTAVIILTTLYCIDMNRMKNNKPVLFSTWGYSYTPPINLKEKELEEAIMNYLTEKGEGEEKHHDNEKTFASMRIYLIDEKKKHLFYNIYAWVVEEKYYSENGKIKQDSASSIPYKFVVENIGEEFTVTDAIVPRDGSYYNEDMEIIFPSSVIKDMKKIQKDGTIEELQSEIQQKKELYFNK